MADDVVVVRIDTDPDGALLCMAVGALDAVVTRLEIFPDTIAQHVIGDREGHAEPALPEQERLHAPLGVRCAVEFGFQVRTERL